MAVHGEVNHSSFYNDEEGSYYYGNSNIRRSIFMGNFIYAISSEGVTATNLTTMEESASIELVFEEQCYYCDAAFASTTSDEETRTEESSDGEDAPERS